MPEPVDWQADGTPRSPRFDDIYRSRGSGLEQACQVFLQGCGLPQAWAGQPQWTILETGFGLGLNFLAAWQAWRDDALRPGLLHFVSVEAWPVAAADLLRSAAAHPVLAPLAAELATQWFGLTAGVHRLAFEGGRVLLSLCIGDAAAALRELDFAADSVFLDGFDPRCNADIWSIAVLKGVARLCRRGTAVASWTAAGSVRQDLATCGFQVHKAPGLPPQRHSLQASYDPGWTLRHPRAAPAVTRGSCLVIGAGLAGAAAAASLARRGWDVQVLDAAATPAAGASALPAGLLAPHHSPDDNQLSRLSRAGVRMTLQQLQAQLPPGCDWSPSGVLEHRASAIRGVPGGDDAGACWTRAADAALKHGAGLPPDAVALWHEKAAWVRPAALVEVWLAQPGIRFLGGRRVLRLSPRPEGGWQAWEEDGSIHTADLVIVAAALASAALLSQTLPLQAVRGQVSWGLADAGLALPPFPLNGNGHFLPAVPRADGGVAWLCGSSYGRGETHLQPTAGEQQANLTRLRELAPAAAAQLQPAFAAGTVQAWTGLRCASADRRPLLGCLQPGLWVSTAMGSRGLSFAALCAELLAARLHGEPLPLERRLAATLDLRRALPTANPTQGLFRP